LSYEKFLLCSILSIGPSFEINAEATAHMDAEVDMRIGINYNINQASFTVPQENGAAGGDFILGDTRTLIISH
jgi:hypothetical protein